MSQRLTSLVPIFTPYSITYHLQSASCFCPADCDHIPSNDLHTAVVLSLRIRHWFCLLRTAHIHFRMSRLQPRPKAMSTFNVTPQSVTSSAAVEKPSTSPITSDITSRPQTPALRSSNRSSAADPVSDRSTLFLIRRTLCSHLVDKGRSATVPIEDILPPLTSSNDVDLQLYAYIAIIIREFVHPWYGKITPDHIFVDEVVKIIAHCTRALEQRIRKVDLQSLLFDELPDLLDVHLRGIYAVQLEMKFWLISFC